MLFLPNRRIAILACATLLLPAAAARSFQLVLAPADVDRAGQVLTFPLPPAAPASPILLGRSYGVGLLLVNLF